jgi:hypothetical protein
MPYPLLRFKQNKGLTVLDQVLTAAGLTAQLGKERR